MENTNKCGEKADDNNSIISDSSWKEQYRGDSRKWIIRDGFTKSFDPCKCSTMKGEYPFPFEEERQYVGERKAKLLEKFMNEAAEEIIREINEPQPIEEYCTEYDGNYKMENGFKPDDEFHVKNEELYRKHPLYSSPAMSYWNFKLGKNRGEVSLPGLTTSIDLKNPFKRYSGFTKPISEVLDECNL